MNFGLKKKKLTLSPTGPIDSHYVFTTCVALNIIISANVRLNIPFFLMCKHLITHVERKKKNKIKNIYEYEYESSM